jgi:hypothetical protein
MKRGSKLGEYGGGRKKGTIRAFCALQLADRASRRNVYAREPKGERTWSDCAYSPGLFARHGPTGEPILLRPRRQEAGTAAT